MSAGPEVAGMVAPPGGIGGLPVPVVAWAALAERPFGAGAVRVPVLAGETLAALAIRLLPSPALLPMARIAIGDMPVPPGLWARVRPRPGALVSVRVLPQGGDSMGAVLGLVVAIAGAALGPVGAGLLGLKAGSLGFSIASGVIGTGVTLVGGLLARALIPPPRLDLRGGERPDPVYSVAGSRNLVLRYQPLPVLIGRHRLWPPYAAAPIRELVGDEQYLRVLYCLGPGPLAIEADSLRLRETALADLEDVEVEIREGWPDDDPPGLYGSPAPEEDVDALLEPDSPVVRTSPPDVRELSVDFSFPSGLVFLLQSGGYDPWTVTLRIEQRPAGSGDAWELVEDLAITDRRRVLVRRAHRWAVAEGQWDVRVTRLTPGTVEAILDDAVWSVLRGHRAGAPVALPGLATIALRIRASGNLAGQIEGFSAVATRVAQDWDAGAGEWVLRPTRNPAAAYRWLLQGAETRDPAPDAEIDLPGLAAWSERCGALGWTCDLVIAQARPLEDWAQLVAATGRAAPGRVDGRHTVVQDDAGQPVTQIVGPRNSLGYQLQRDFAPLPHGLRVRYIDADADWAESEVIVYAPGYDAGSATRLEEAEAPGETSHGLAVRRGRRLLAEARLRPEVHQVLLSHDHLVARRGSRVRLVHDAILVGLGSARVRARIWDGAETAVIAVSLDAEYDFESATDYALELRRDGAAPVTVSLAQPAGRSAEIVFAAPLPPETAPLPGDLVLVGPAERTSLDLMVRSIEPQRWPLARLTLVDTAPDLAAAEETGDIPPYDPMITLPGDWRDARPGAPEILWVRSDDAVMAVRADGRREPRIVVRARPAPGLAAVARWEARYRPIGAGEWSWMDDAPGDRREIGYQPVSEGEVYDLELRTVSVDSVASIWARIDAHQVVGRADPPPAPTGLVAAPDIGAVLLSVDLPADRDAVTAVYYAASSDDRAAAVEVTRGPVAGATRYAPGGGLARWYWARLASRAGLLGPFNGLSGLAATTGTAGSAEIAAGAVTAQQMADEAIQASAFAAGIEPVGLVAGLPDPGTWDGPAVVLDTTDGKLHRWVDGSWTAAVPTADLIGEVVGAQIAAAAVTADNLAANAVTAGALAANAVAAANLQDQIVSAEKLVANAVTSAALAASAVTSAALAANAVTAAKIAANAVGAAALAANAVTAGKIAAAAVAAAQIETGAVLTEKLADAAVSGQKIAANAVTATQIAAGAVTAAQIAANAVTAGTIAAGAVTTAALAAHAVTAAQIAAGTITAAELAVGDFSNLCPNPAFYGGTAHSWVSLSPAIDIVARGGTGGSAVINAPSAYLAAVPDDGAQYQGQYLSRLAVTPGDRFYVQMDVAAGGLGADTAIRSLVVWRRADETQIAQQSRVMTVASLTWQATDFAQHVAPAEAAFGDFYVRRDAGGDRWTFFTNIKCLRVTDSVSIADGAVSAGKVAANAITAMEIAANAVTAAQIAAGAVTTGALAANAVVAGTIAAGAVTTGKLAANAVTAAQIAAGAVTAAQIAANAVTAAEIAAGAVTTGKLAANAVTAAQIAVGAVTAAQIAANAVTAAQIAAGAVTAGALAANAVVAGTIAAGAVSTSQLAASAVSADKLAVGAVVASRLAVTDMSNIVANSALDDLDGWLVDAQVTGSVDALANMASARAVRIPAGISANRFIRWESRVSPGKSYYMSAEARASGSSNPYAEYRHTIQWLDRTGASLGFAIGPPLLLTTIDPVVETYAATAPAGAVAARFLFGRLASGSNVGDLNIGSPVVRVMGDGELIVDGAITTEKLVANSITVDKLTANSVVTSKISNNAVSEIFTASSAALYESYSGSGNNSITRTLISFSTSDQGSGKVLVTLGSTEPMTSDVLQAGGLTIASGVAGSGWTVTTWRVAVERRIGAGSWAAVKERLAFTPPGGLLLQVTSFVDTPGPGVSVQYRAICHFSGTNSSGFARYHEVSQATAAVVELKK